MTLQEYLREQLNLPTIGRLGASLGLRATRAVPIANEVLPAQLDQLQQIASTSEGSRQLWDLAQNRVPAGTLQQLIGTAEGLKKLQASGETLLPEVMGPSYLPEITRLAVSGKVNETQVRQLMELLLPLLLSLIAGRASAEKLKPASLGTLFGGVAAVGAVTPATLSSKPEVVAQSVPMREVPVAQTVPPARSVQEAPERRGFGWLWMLPLLLLLLLGGCFLLRDKGVAGLTLSTPQRAARTADGDPLTSPGTDVTLNRAVKVAVAVARLTAPAASSGIDSATPPTPLTMIPLASDRTVQAGALTLNGTSLGQTRTDASGAWNSQVLSPAARAQTYTATAGSASSALKLTVAAGTAQA